MYPGWSAISVRRLRPSHEPSRRHASPVAWVPAIAHPAQSTLLSAFERPKSTGGDELAWVRHSAKVQSFRWSGGLDRGSKGHLCRGDLLREEALQRAAGAENTTVRLLGGWGDGGGGERLV